MATPGLRSRRWSRSWHSAAAAAPLRPCGRWGGGGKVGEGFFFVVFGIFWVVFWYFLGCFWCFLGFFLVFFGLFLVFFGVVFGILVVFAFYFVVGSSLVVVCCGIWLGFLNGLLVVWVGSVSGWVCCCSMLLFGFGLVFRVFVVQETQRNEVKPSSCFSREQNLWDLRLEKSLEALLRGKSQENPTTKPSNKHEAYSSRHSTTTLKPFEWWNWKKHIVSLHHVFACQQCCQLPMGSKSPLKSCLLPTPLQICTYFFCTKCRISTISIELYIPSPMDKKPIWKTIQKLRNSLIKS